MWSLLGNEAPDALNRVTHPIGYVEMGCVVSFTIVDDDVDSRINYFRLDGSKIYTVGQGMVTSGKIIIPDDGMLSIEANDSIGLYIDSCESKVTMTPTVTTTPTMTPTSTMTPTATIEPTATVEPTVTTTPESSPTATVAPDSRLRCG
ncbi:MAG: hypothetical protein R3C44_02740 [Chloroflexota bacterium]